MTQIVGGIVTIGIGVIVIAAIYQLGKPTNPIVGATQSVTNTTLASLFKGTG
jgi:hypothetical protein